MQIPQSQYLPIDKLASVFSSTSATYKFYWFLAILELVEGGHVQIAKRNIFSRMISNSWYTVNYFHVSFGKQDLIQDAVKALIKIENLQINENKNIINAVLENSAPIAQVCTTLAQNCILCPYIIEFFETYK